MNMYLYRPLEKVFTGLEEAKQARDVAGFNRLEEEMRGIMPQLDKPQIVAMIGTPGLIEMREAYQRRLQQLKLGWIDY